MRKILISILIILSFFVANEKSLAQTITIKNATVINDLGHVRISWEYTGTDTISITRDDLVNFKMEEIADITNPNETTFIDYTAQANARPRAYRIADNEGGVWSDLVSTYYLTNSYDSCLRQIDLSWTELIDPILIYDWTATQFYINIIEDSVPQSKISVSATENQYTVRNVKDNINYKIFIETEWQGQDSTSNSNPISLFTQMPITPDYINSISTVVNGDDIEIKFEIDPNTELNTYKLLKSDSETGSFDTVETYTTSEFELTTIDNTSNPSSEINYYKLISLNQCGNITDNSDIINNMLLETEIADFDITLNWNGFNDNMNGKDYKIYRSINNLEPELVGSFSNSTNFNDNIESFQNYSQFCYFIQSTESGTTTNDYSQSNTACVYLKPKVYIPEAFTPNGDGHNDYFKAIFSFVPTEFDFKVYNRWGNTVFETKEYTEAWDGKISNGNPAPAGAYIYYIKMRSPNNQIIEKRGSIIVIHP